MEMLAKSADNRLIVSQLSVIELQSVFAAKVRMRVIDQASLNQLRGLFFRRPCRRPIQGCPRLRSLFSKCRPADSYARRQSSVANLGCASVGGGARVASGWRWDSL